MKKLLFVIILALGVGIMSFTESNIVEREKVSTEQIVIEDLLFAPETYYYWMPFWEHSTFPPRQRICCHPTYNFSYLYSPCRVTELYECKYVM